MRLVLRLAEHADEGILVTDADNRIIYLNEGFSRMMGYTLAEARGQKPSLFKSGVHDDAFYKKMWTELKNRGYWHGTVWDQRKDGTLIERDTQLFCITDIRGRARGYAAIHKDVTELREIASQRDRLQYFQQQTGLPNEHYLRRRLSTLIERAVPFQLIMIKLVNRAQLEAVYTTAELDEALASAVKQLEIGQEGTGFLAQIDDDYIAIILYSKQSQTELFLQELQQVHQALSRPLDKGVHFQVSQGVVAFPDDAEAVSALLSRAKIAVEQAVETQTDSVHYSPALHERLSYQQRMKDAMEPALRAGEFFVNYQPIHAISDWRIIGFECLLRWRSKEMGEISPDWFIPVAEQYGWIDGLTDFVLEEGLDAKRDFEEAAGRPLYLFINISGKQLVGERLLRRVAKAAEQVEDPSTLTFEITESSFLEAIEVAVEQVKKIKRHGVKIAIDDFGTGYSSFRHLHRLPADILKVDKSFLSIPEHGGREIVKNAALLGRNLKLHVLIEGVEKEAHLDVITEAGAQYAQGFYLNRPLHRSDVLPILKKTAT